MPDNYLKIKELTDDYDYLDQFLVRWEYDRLKDLSIHVEVFQQFDLFFSKEGKEWFEIYQNYYHKKIKKRNDYLYLIYKDLYNDTIKCPSAYTSIKKAEIVQIYSSLCDMPQKKNFLHKKFKCLEKNIKTFRSQMNKVDINNFIKNIKLL